MQSSFSVNNIALVNGRPMQLNLKDLIREFVDHRHVVVTRRSQFELDKALDRAHIVEGLIIAVDNIDEVIRIIRSSQTAAIAMERLRERFELSELQARAIVDMRLRALVGLEHEKLRLEFEELMKTIERLRAILASIELRMEIVKEELLEIKNKYGDERRSEIVYSSEEFNPEDFYADDDMVITLSHMGYIKRTPLSEYRSQGRGGVGAKGSDTRDEDFIEYLYSASMHATLMLFTDQGKCYWLKVYEIPEGSKNSKGRAIQNLLNLDTDSRVNALIRIKNLTTDEEFVNSHYIFFCTKRGIVKKTLLEAFSRPRANGVRAIDLRDDEKVVSVRLTNGNCDIVIANRNGRAIRFHEDKVRASGRTSMGVRGMTLDNDPNDEVVGMICIKHPEEQSVLVVSENGFGKRSLIEDYRITNRGGKGVKTLQITQKTGKLVAIRAVREENDLMIINKSGVAIRMSIAGLSILGRATQGVKLIDLQKRGDEIASVCSVAAEEEENETEVLSDEANVSATDLSSEEIEGDENNSNEE